MLKPTFNNIKIRPYLWGEKTNGGLFIPEPSQKRLQPFGEITAVGDGSTEKPMTFKVGDIVLLPAKKNNYYDEDKVKHLICSQYDIYLSKNDKLQARQAWVLITPEKEYDGPIVMIEETLRHMGKVISVGEQCEVIKEGDRVYYEGARTIYYHDEDGTTYELVHYLDVKAIL